MLVLLSSLTAMALAVWGFINSMGRETSSTFIALFILALARLIADIAAARRKPERR